MAGGGELLSGEEMQKAHPGLRLFDMHPDIGLRESEAETLPLPVRVRDLSVAWLALPFAEQRMRERDMLRGALLHAFAGGEARYVAYDDEDVRLSPESPPVIRALTSAAIDRLLARTPNALIVESAGRTLLETTDWDAEPGDTRPIGIWTDPWKKDELQGELMRAWWEPAQARRAALVTTDTGRVSRETRAWIYRAWETHGHKLFFAVSALIALGLMEETFVNVAVAFVVVWTLLVTIGDALRLWYERD